MTLPKLKIALAEDSALNRMLWVSLFKEWNDQTEVVIAKNGFQLVELVRNNRFDVVLTDINMPEIDGVLATKIIREFNPFVPIIGVSGNAHDEEVKDYLAAGMNKYLTKPVQFKVLLKSIGELLDLDLFNAEVNSLSGLYGSLKKIASSDIEFDKLKDSLHKEIDNLIELISSGNANEQNCHVLVNKLINVNQSELVEVARSIETCLRNKQHYQPKLELLRKAWVGFVAEQEAI